MQNSGKATRKNKVSARLFKTSGKVSTIDRVLHKFKELLKGGELKPGDRIPNETELAKSFGTSRGSIREAVKMLASTGVLQVRWGDGTYVANSLEECYFDHSLFQLFIADNDNQKLLELREIMECGLVKLAVDHALPEDLEAIEAAHRELVDAIAGGEKDPGKLAAIDAKFHLAISKATHNPFVDKIYHFAMELYYPSIVVTHENRDVEEMQQSPAVHQAIIQAIRKRNHAAAIKAVSDSLKTWFDHL